MRSALIALALLALAPGAHAADPKSLEFKLTFDKAACDVPFSGRVYVTIRSNGASPPVGMNWFKPEPGLAKDVKNWKPGEPLVLNAKAVAYPAPLADLKPGEYHVSAVMDRDLGGIDFLASPGNVYAKTKQLDLDPKTSGTIELKLDQVVKAREFKDTDTVKLVEVESKLLSKFHGKPMSLRGGVVLPPSFAKEPNRKYPVVYEVPGFGGNHFAAAGAAARKAWDVNGTEMIWVVLDPNCRLGHHVFADSENNGPVGRALVEELIPHLEKIYRGNGTRFATGHSSGGWSSLWLQVAHPDTFAGCWSTAPDPVDFRDFQLIDLYAKGVNTFTDADGKPRPLGRANGKPMLFFKPFSDMEEYMTRGGQLGSFEAVFSPRGADGHPQHLWNRATGAVDPKVAKTWEKYDIRLVLERNWKTLGPKLGGKIHVYMGDEDTFYLEGATRLLKQSLADLKSDAVVELFPKRNHGNLVDPVLRKRMNEEMASSCRKTEKATR
ncbi:Putative esterase [Gemmata sp. SH-PL17]|uniref:alpha/beta hydrolase-fold protein n=1 Tax=Gemmata sp. SH-PL17 TaxID=1630693 RepID=UPI00078E5DBB|nr:alpha/beta hydrolase-fold protein [Gemmata sp. SH-PL17]AMV29538.1 Putative esterase [Gemmata sp. SH-PL17]